MKKKTKRVLAIVLALVLVLMLIPIRTAYYDGGTVKYSAVLWQIEKLHKMLDADGNYLVGTRVTLLCGLIPVYDDTSVVTDP